MKFVFMLAVCFLSFAFSSAFAHGLEDECITFSTKGPDRYSDGTVVLDGECYALVWSADGVFEGFAAGGACIDEKDKVVLIAPVAKDGRCPPVLFQVPAALATDLSGGKYALYLLDTRVASNGNEVVRGVKEGKLELINGYGAVSSQLKASGVEGNSLAAEICSGGIGQKVSSVAAIPQSCAQPKVKALRIEGDYVYLTVENLKGFMRVQEGADVKAMNTTGAALETAGDSAETVLVAPKGGASGFYRVVRNAPSVEK